MNANEKIKPIKVKKIKIKCKCPKCQKIHESLLYLNEDDIKKYSTQFFRKFCPECENFKYHYNTDFEENIRKYNYKRFSINYEE